MLIAACACAASCSTNDVVEGNDGTPDTRHVIPDVAFAEYLQYRGVGNVYEEEGAFTLSERAAAAVTGKLDVRKNAGSITALEGAGVASAATKIASLEGIQYFTGVDTLLLVSNELTALDVSALARLVMLDINANFITSLDLSANTALTYLRFGASARTPALLSGIDLSANTALEHLDLNGHALAAIDLSANTALKEVDLSGNPGAPFAIPAAIFDRLTTGNGVVSDADVPPPPPVDETREIADVAFAEYLQYLQAGNVQLVDGKYLLDVAAAATMTGKLDLRKNANRITVLTNAGVASAATKITNLDGIQYFTNVDTLQLTSNELPSIDLSALARLVYLDLNNNFVSSLDLSANTALKYLSFTASTKATEKLSSINLSANTALVTLNLSSHALATIDLSANTALKSVTLTGNPGTPFTIPAAIFDQLTTAQGVQK
jgi:Leucine-rich repeat (LRR) protein